MTEFSCLGTTQKDKETYVGLFMTRATVALLKEGAQEKRKALKSKFQSTLL